MEDGELEEFLALPVHEKNSRLESRQDRTARKPL